MLTRQASVFLCAAIAAALCSGCVDARRASESRHELREYVPVGSKSVLVRAEVRRDRTHGGGAALFADPKASGFYSAHTNQSALGGGGSLTLGSIESTVSTNAVKSVADKIPTSVP